MPRVPATPVSPNEEQLEHHAKQVVKAPRAGIYRGRGVKKATAKSKANKTRNWKGK